jgi:hypothetical protein
MTEIIGNNQKPEQNEQSRDGSVQESASRFLQEIHSTFQVLPKDSPASGSDSHRNDPNYPKLIITDGTSNRPSDLSPDNKHRIDDGSLLSSFMRLPREREITGGLPIGIEGKFTTATGDQIEINNGKQKLTTAGGKTFEVDKDGNISGDGVTSIKASKDGKERVVTLEDGTSVLLDRNGIARVEHPMPADKPGVYKLNTGDTIDTSADKQTLTTPAGTRLTVNKDGSYEVDGKVVSASADGQTIKLGDGSVVHLKDGKIAGVERNGTNARLCGTISSDQWDPRNSSLPPPPWNYPEPSPRPHPTPNPIPNPRSYPHPIPNPLPPIEHYPQFDRPVQYPVIID